MTANPYAEDVDTLGPTDAQLGGITALAHQQIDLEDKIAEAEVKLKELNESLRRVAEADLPEALSAAGLESFSLTGGFKVGVKTQLFGSIIKDNAEDAFSWLEDTGHGDLVKRDVTVSFGKGQGSLAEKLLTFVKASFASLKCSDRKNVHPQTLNAFVREQVTIGTELPPSIGVTTVRRATIARPKEAAL